MSPFLVFLPIVFVGAVLALLSRQQLPAVPSDQQDEPAAGAEEGSSRYERDVASDEEAQAFNWGSRPW